MPFKTALILLATAVMMSGCGWTGLLSDDTAPAPVTFEDLAVPPELTVAEGDSRVYDGPGGRIGRLKASGRINSLAVVQYYRESMVQNGWTRQGEFDNEGHYLLVYAKAPRAAAITITEGWVYTDVEINVSASR